jgi:putative transposase
MARHLRIEYPGAVYHVISRGNARENIYLDDTDRQAFLKIVGEAVKRQNIILHTYCLMNNHYHLLLETPDGNLSMAMKQINGIYTQKFNLRHKRCGHVFQGRYKSILVERDSYLLELCRYISLNPVRTGLVKLPEEYRWSSYRAATGRDNAPEWLDLIWIKSCFSPDMEKAAAMYEKFVMEGIDKPAVIPDNGIAIGNESYLLEIKELAKGSGLERRRGERYINRPELKSIFHEDTGIKDRNRAIYRAYVDHAYTQREIAAYLGISYVTISRAIKESDSASRSEVNS